MRPIDGRAEVALVHRPRYDDWSFPKGKLMAGESHLEAALREVSEETGVSCRVVAELPTQEYQLGDGMRKTVRYWFMEPTADTALHPTREVDEAVWLPIGDAGERLTYDRDREVLAAAVARSQPVYLIRHAKAGSRSEWVGRDELRPLSRSGRRQAKALLHAFEGRRVGRILSSPAIRCVETVRPLAAARGRSIEELAELAEGASMDGAQALLDGNASDPLVLCGHGDVIPALVERAEAAGAVVEGERGWKKGSAWILDREAGVVVRLTYLPPAEPEGRSSGRGRRNDRRRRQG